MNIKLQIISFLISFVYGIFINYTAIIHFKVNNKNNFLSYILTIFYAYLLVIFYIDIMYFVNGGFFHIYFIILMILGYICANKIKQIVKSYVKKKKKKIK